MFVTTIPSRTPPNTHTDTQRNTHQPSLYYIPSGLKDIHIYIEIMFYKITKAIHWMSFSIHSIPFSQQARESFSCFLIWTFQRCLPQLLQLCQRSITISLHVPPNLRHPIHPLVSRNPAGDKSSLPSPPPPPPPTTTSTLTCEILL